MWENPKIFCQANLRWPCIHRLIFPVMSTFWAQHTYFSESLSSSTFSRKYWLDHLTHLSVLPEAHNIASQVVRDPACASSGNISGVLRRWIFLNSIHCSPSFNIETMFGWWLRDLLLMPALASPTTWFAKPGCRTQQCVPCRSGVCTHNSPAKLTAIGANIICGLGQGRVVRHSPSSFWVAVLGACFLARKLSLSQSLVRKLHLRLSLARNLSLSPSLARDRAGFCASAHESGLHRLAPQWSRGVLACWSEVDAACPQMVSRAAAGSHAVGWPVCSVRDWAKQFVGYRLMRHPLLQVVGWVMPH